MPAGASRRTSSPLILSRLSDPFWVRDERPCYTSCYCTRPRSTDVVAPQIHPRRRITIAIERPPLLDQRGNTTTARPVEIR